MTFWLTKCKFSFYRRGKTRRRWGLVISRPTGPWSSWGEVNHVRSMLRSGTVWTGVHWTQGRHGGVHGPWGVGRGVHWGEASHGAVLTCEHWWVVVITCSKVEIRGHSEKRNYYLGQKRGHGCCWKVQRRMSARSVADCPPHDCCTQYQVPRPRWSLQGTQPRMGHPRVWQVRDTCQTRGGWCPANWVVTGKALFDTEASELYV